MNKWTRVSYGCDQNPGVFDTGNGAIKYICVNRDYPGIERVVIRSYCGRDSDNCRYYRLADDTSVQADTIASLKAKARKVKS